MSIAEEVVIGERIAPNEIDRVIAGRFACREFSNRPVARRTIEDIFRVARYAPSGANIQPWHVYALAGAAKREVSAVMLDAHERARDAHVSEYKYYADVLPSPYLDRKREFGRLFYGSL